jgi:hypothetical protein
MKRRACLGWLLAAGCGTARAELSEAERARIYRLIDAVGQRKDIRFVRNGKEYTSVQAADFLRGKLQWNIEKVHSMKDFITVVGTGSTTSGQIYQVRLADGRLQPSAEFLAQELRRIEKKR